MTGRSRTCIVNERAGQLCNRAWNANDPHYTLRCIGFQYGRLPTEKKYEYAKVFLLFPLVSSSFHLGEAISDGSTPHDRACLLIMGQRSLEKRRRLSWADLKQKNVICRAGDSCFITNTFVVF